MSVTVNWRGKIGYGDIISPICYAHNQADRLQQQVDLNFFFEHSEGTKFKPTDYENINQRVDYIAKNTTPSIHGVNVNQTYNTKIDYNHTNYSDSPLSYHNLRFSKTPWTGDSNHIAVVSSLSNKKQFFQYARGKQWKDPLVGKWDQYIKEWSNKYSIKLVHYETPIHEAVEIINSSQLVIGYHGSAMWLARWLAAPMVVYSNRAMTKAVFPWCIQNPKSIDIDIHAEQSLKLLDWHKEELKEYISDIHWSR